MAGLKLCGVAVPITEASRSDYFAEDRARAFDGTPRAVVRARKRELQLRAGVKSANWTDALRRLVNGEGHAWSFDADLYSSKGLGHSAGSASIIGGGGKYVSGIDVAASVAFPISASAGTVLAWKRLGDASTWEHFIRIGSSTYKNGVLATSEDMSWLNTSGVLELKAWAPIAWTASAPRSLGALTRPTTANGRTYRCTTAGTTGATEPTWPTTYGATVADGTVVWTDIGPTTIRFDELVYLPFAVPSDWTSQLYAEHDARAFPALPRLRAEGDLIHAGPLTVLGQSGSADVLSYMDGGALVAAGESLSFGLSEV